MAKTWRPDVVLAGSGLTSPAALIAARLTGARAAVYVHGLDVAFKHPVYRAVWHRAISRMDIVIANSTPTAQLLADIGIAKTDPRLRIVFPGVRVPKISQTSDSIRDFRARHDLGDKRLLLSIGRLTARKGLREFVERSLPKIVEDNPDVLLLVIGDAPTESLHADVQTRQSIQQSADSLGIGKCIRFLGVITDPHALACAYEGASAHVFPVRSIVGDPEGFGMVAIEAAAHGLPTIAFSTGGITDAVSEGRSGTLIPPNDYAMFTEAVRKILSDGKSEWESTSKAFAKSFVWPTFGRKMIEALNGSARQDH